MKIRGEIQKGTTLIEEKPFVHILSSKYHTKYCETCFNSDELLKCSGCQYVHYCGRECQKAAWSIHKYECENIKRVAPRTLPDAARFLAKLIIKLNKGGAFEKSYYEPNRFRQFKDLMSHYAEIKLDPLRMEHFTSLCGVLFEFFSDFLLPNSVELLGIYGRMVVNGFSIVDAELNSIGSGIYLGASIIDHSCSPNAVAVFDGVKLYIRTVKTLPKLDWTKVFISYIDELNSDEERIQELKANYYFKCSCMKCIGGDDTPFTTAAACPNEKCDAPIDINECTHCPKCDTEIKESFKIEFLEIMHFSKLQIQSMKNTTYLDVCKVCLSKQDKLFHSLNIFHVKILDLAFESSIKMEKWQDAKQFGTELLKGYHFYLGEIHPLIGLLNLKLGKLALSEGEAEKAVDLLRNASDILRVTHGENHSLYVDTVIPLLQQAILESS